MSLWTDYEALVRSMQKLKEFDPISAYTKNDPNLYAGVREAMNQIEMNEIFHVRGHQDKGGRELNHIEKLNALADKLATRAINESKAAELECNPETEKMLEIAGTGRSA